LFEVGWNNFLELVHPITMRGNDPTQSAMFSYLTLAQRIPADHPARQIRALVDRALVRLDAEFEKLYSSTGRPSIAPERLLRATLLMILFSIRSERQLMEQLNYNLLFRWFVGLEMDDAVWDVTVFTKNRERLIAGAVSQQFLEAVLVVAAKASQSATVTEREAAVELLDCVLGAEPQRGERKITLGADTQYQEERFIQALRDRGVAPHVSEYAPGNRGKNALSDGERSDARRSISQRRRKLIERVFGWSKLDRPMRQVKLRGLKRVDWFYRLTITAYNLVRMRKLIPIQAMPS
jgi:transposase